MKKSRKLGDQGAVKLSNISSGPRDKNRFSTTPKLLNRLGQICRENVHWSIFSCLLAAVGLQEWIDMHKPRVPLSTEARGWDQARGSLAWTRPTGPTNRGGFTVNFGVVKRRIFSKLSLDLVSFGPANYS